ncbi:MAG: hypothetical protein JNN33_06385 [Rhodospirillaceae bacterium]|jgi:hypothetical protein|nr:hypothetical protein [Rhodospirillaceae bacterium]
MWAILLFALVIGIVWTQWHAVSRWTGIWRWLAAAPLTLLGLDLALILVETSIDPTSHNLWPLELLFIGAAGLPVIVVLWVLRKLLGATAT